MTRLSRLASTTALCLAVTASPIVATAQTTDPEPGLMDLFSPNRIASFVANAGIAAIRTQMELQYEHLSTDILRGTISISGITARPQLPYDQARQCEITIDRAMLNSDLSQPFQSESELTLDLIGARATLACLERDVALGLRSAGFNELSFDQARVTVSYVYATGETTLDSTMAVNGFATLDFSGAGTLLPRMTEFGYPGDPAIRVSRAVVSLKDHGAWEAMSAMLPANLRDPEAVRQMGTELILQELSAGGTRAPGAVERNFVNQLMERVQAFVADPGEITIEANLPPGGAVVEPEMLDDPVQLIGTLALDARTAPRVRSELLDSSIVAGIADPAALSEAERVALARALLDGTGVPLAPALVPGLLADVVAGSGPDAAQASALTARALEATDPAAAYVLALGAAAGGADGAVSQLDRLEARMTTGAVVQAQTDYLAQSGRDLLATISGDDPRDLRALSLDYLTGDGQPRSYERAYVLVLLAEAAGDFAATPLRNDIEARFAGRGADVTALWSALAGAAQTQALDLWIDRDLAAIYRRN